MIPSFHVFPCIHFVLTVAYVWSSIDAWVSYSTDNNWKSAMLQMSVDFREISCRENLLKGGSFTLPTLGIQLGDYTEVLEEIDV